MMSRTRDEGGRGCARRARAHGYGGQADDPAVDEAAAGVLVDE